MKITYMGQRIDQPVQKRNKAGRFTKKSKVKMGIAIVAFGFFGSMLFNHTTPNVAVADNDPADIAKAYIGQKVDALQSKVLEDISSCETAGTKEPNAAIILDTNSQMSIGSFMFQITTVQHYIKKFEGRDITRVEAIQIAIDHEKAKELARKIVFTEKDGAINNWYNCSLKNNVQTRVQIINSL